MPTSGRRKPPKSPAPPLDLEEIEQDPGFRGMLSFLDVSPEQRGALLAQRAEAERQSPMGETAAPPAAETPMGQLPDVLPSAEAPAGGSGAAESAVPDVTRPARPDALQTEASAAQTPAELTPPAHAPLAQRPTGQNRPEVAWDIQPTVIPYMDVEGRGRRPLRYCQTVQDGHTASEQLAYQALWEYARQHGRPEPEGSYLLDLGLAQLCRLLASDHKNVKRLLGSLQEKLAIEVVTKPDYRLAIPTRYRVFSGPQILARRRDAGLVWVVRTRAVRFVNLETVARLIAESAAGESPTDGTPEGESASDRFPAWLARQLKEWVAIDDRAVRQLWNACRRGSPECTEEEVLWFCRAKEPLIRAGRIERPVALLLRSVPPFFAEGGATALLDYRRERDRERERDRRRERQAAQFVLDDPASTEAELAWAREVVAAEQGSGGE
jgi:hypothetical protein